jgi:superfamily II DNA/RNA helicase
MAFDTQKNALLLNILAQYQEGSIILFAGTKDKVKEIERDLRYQKIPVKAFHSDLDQSVREEIMRNFRNRELRMLIGTDILSRGIDIDGISLVINYDVPADAEDYVHRIGRTARAATTGTAVTFINPKDVNKFAGIEKLIGYEIEKLPLPEHLGEAPVYKATTKSKKQFKPKSKPFKKTYNKPKQ